MIKFTPTREQLEKLAKVAGLKTYIDSDGSFSINDETHRGDYVFEPHLDRNQISMILEGMSDGKLWIRYENKMFRFWSDPDLNMSNPNIWFSVWMQTVDPSISCEQILKVLEG